MKTRLTRLVASFLFALVFCSIAHPSLAESLPEFRPALLGQGPRSLINKIDAESLMKRGQRDGLIMFSCGVTETGQGYSMQVYRCTPNSELLQKEVLGRIRQIQFEPAVYHHTHVGVWIGGTIVFAIKNGKPHLRIYLNQEESDLMRGNDFIAPQFAFVGGNTAFKGIYWPSAAPGHEGVASMMLDVDATGHVSNPKVIYEHPAGMGFGAAAAGPIRDKIFLPGFRNGKAVPCRFNWSIFFFGSGLQMRSG